MRAYACPYAPDPTAARESPISAAVEQANTSLQRTVAGRRAVPHAASAAAAATVGDHRTPFTSSGLFRKAAAAVPNKKAMPA